MTQFDAKQLERGLVCSPGHLPTLYGVLSYGASVDYLVLCVYGVYCMSCIVCIVYCMSCIVCMVCTVCLVL